MPGLFEDCGAKSSLAIFTGFGETPAFSKIDSGSNRSISDGIRPPNTSGPLYSWLRRSEMDLHRCSNRSVPLAFKKLRDKGKMMVP